MGGWLDKQQETDRLLDVDGQTENRQFSACLNKQTYTDQVKPLTAYQLELTRLITVTTINFTDQSISLSQIKDLD